MFSYFSSFILLLLLVMTCAFQAIHTRDKSPQKYKAIVHRQDPENCPGDTAGYSNADCSSENGQIPTAREPIKCQDGFACVNTGYLIRSACHSCKQNGHMSSDDDYQCLNMLKDYQTAKAVKVSCSNATGTWKRPGGIYPIVSKTRWISWGSSMQDDWGQVGSGGMCPCLKRYVAKCKGKGKASKKRIKCVAKQMRKCSKVCTSFKMRVNEAEGISLIEAKGEQKLIDRARVLVDSQGKPVRNASASMMSLDDTVGGKCSQ